MPGLIVTELSCGRLHRNPKLSGTTHNVFGIQVGVCITLLVKLPGKSKDAKRSAKIYYHAVPVDWRKEKKYEFLEIKQSVDGVKWQKLQPDKKQNWLDMGRGIASSNLSHPFRHREFEHARSHRVVANNQANGLIQRRLKSL